MIAQEMLWSGLVTKIQWGAYLDRRGLAMTIMSDLMSVKEVWMSECLPQVLKGFHADRKATRAIACVRGEFYHVAARPDWSEHTETFLRPGGTVVMLAPGVWSAVVSLGDEPSTLVYCQDQTISDCQPLTAPYESLGNEIAWPEFEKRRLSLRDLGR